YTITLCVIIMNKDFYFFKTILPKTRIADYCLGCLDSSVFIDFNRTEDNCISIIRISFDGYGCCELDNSAQSLNKSDSVEFIEQIESEKLNQEIITRLIKKIVSKNKNQIWTEAIKEYGLLKD
ncbi:hypothetical protein ACU8DI_15395, partial [Psychroserpens sp. BH13MA-6]